MELYPYQKDVIAEIERQLDSVNRICVRGATGAGKTVIFCELIKRAYERREGSLVLAHRHELITQPSRKLVAIGINHGIIKAGFPMRLDKRVQVASIQTLFERAVRGKKIQFPHAQWVFIDEAHHVRAMTYMSIVKAYPAARVIGFTATPCRGDGRGLGNVFQALVQCPDEAELTRLGFLVPAKVFAPVRLDLTGLRVQRGDYVEAELEKRVNTSKLVGDIVEHWLRLGERRRTVVFTAGVAHSRHICEEFQKAGVRTKHLDGTTPTDERERILAALKSGSVDIVTNCMVLTEGWDCPEAACAVLARPTKSLGLFRQMVGRILRAAPGKKDAILLDHSGAVFEHGLPDDPINWTLSEDSRAENAVHASRGRNPHMPELVECPNCHAVRLEGRPCPNCGWRYMPKPKPIDVAPGELVAVGRDRQAPAPIDQLGCYRQLRGYAAAHAYKPGWAAHQFKSIFGSYPPLAWNGVDPLPPSAGCAAWVRSRNRAYARGLGR